MTGKPNKPDLRRRNNVGGNTTDMLFGQDGQDLMLGGAGNDWMSGGYRDVDSHGNPDADIMYGGVGNDSMYGGGHNDVMIGEAGADYIDGQSGNDVLIGGIAGTIFDFSRDTLRGGSGADVFIVPFHQGRYGYYGFEDTWADLNGSEGDGLNVVMLPRM